MDNVTDAIQDNRNLIKSIAEPLAVIGLERTGQSIAGKALTPAVWALDYGLNNKTPDKIDLGLYGSGLAGGPVGVAAITVGIFKGFMDDDLERQVNVVRADYDSDKKPLIKACYHYSTNPPQISALKIAQAGGTAWQHSTGIWVYITDARGYMIPNFEPVSARVIYRPTWPLEQISSNTFRFTQVRPR